MNKSSQPNQSLVDGIAVLHALASSNTPIGGRELARSLKLEPTRVNRILKTLAYLGITRQNSKKKYMPGPGMHVLATQSLFGSSIVQHALPILEELRRFNHVVAFGVLWKGNVSYLYHAPPGIQHLEALGRIGVYPATKGGIGLALLAQKEDEMVREIYQDDSIPNFPDGIESLLRTLHEIREQGYARVQVKPEQHTIAVHVGEPAYAAVGVSGWIPSEATKSILDVLNNAAQQLGESEESLEVSSENLDVDFSTIRPSI